MHFSQALNCPVAQQPPSEDALRCLFDWYLTLAISYETLSNIAQGILIKDATQMLAAVRAGGGGHCVEHSVLLTALLKEYGYVAELINADYHDHQRQIRMGIAKPLVLVRLAHEWWVCDPYYRAIMYPVPSHGVVKWKTFDITRLTTQEFSITRRQRGLVVDEDHANCAWTIETRKQQFETRYRDFSPFGVTAPFFQLLRPVRQAVFYSPRRDSLIVVDGDSFRTIESVQLADIGWLPTALRPCIVSALPMLRSQREAALDFLNQGKFPVYYERLRETNASPA